MKPTPLGFFHLSAGVDNAFAPDNDHEHGIGAEDPSPSHLKAMD